MTRHVTLLLMITAAALAGCGDDSGGSGPSGSGTGNGSTPKVEANRADGAPVVSAYRDGDGWRVAVAVGRPVLKIALVAGKAPAQVRTFDDGAAEGDAATWSAGFHVPAATRSVRIVVTGADGTETKLTRALDD